MKIFVVENPKGIVHYHNGNKYNLDGRYVLVEIAQNEYRSLPEKVQDLIRDRWSHKCQINEHQLACYFSLKPRWELLAKLVGDSDISASLFLDYTRITKQETTVVEGKKAWELITLLFRICQTDNWKFSAAGKYTVKRSGNREIAISVPGEAYSGLVGRYDYQQKHEQLCHFLGLAIIVEFPR